MQFIIFMASFLENIVWSIFIISTICSHAGAEHAILTCGLGEQYEKYQSKTPANECEQLFFHEIPTTDDEICRTFNDTEDAKDLKTRIRQKCADESEYQYLNQDYKDKDFSFINKNLKTTFSVKVNGTTKLWEIEIDCRNQKYGNITCKRKEANLTIWVIGFDEQQKKLIHRTIENSRLSHTTSVTSGTDRGDQNTPHQGKSELDDNFHVGTSVISTVTLIIGFILGLFMSITIAWFQGSNIQSFLKPLWYHVKLHSSNTRRKTTDQITRFTPAYNYLECTAMNTVELPCKAESILDVAISEENILSVSGRGTYIDKSPIPNVNMNGWFMWNGLMSCFCCKSSKDDNVTNVPEDIKYPWSMAVDSFNKCVYVSGYQNDSICRIPLVQGENALPSKKWSVFNREKPAAVQVSLSMEQNGNIIVVSLEVNWLEEYSSDGELLKKIKLQDSDDYAHIQHAVKRADDNYVLVHGWKEDKYHRVCLVDGEGILKASYGHSKGDAIGDNGQLNTPTHLAVDRNNFVLVTDYNNHRIILLDPDLKFVKVLITPDAGLYRPCRLILDERKEDGRVTVRLFVGEDRKEPKARIMVFFLKRREAIRDSEYVLLTSIESSTTE